MRFASGLFVAGLCLSTAAAAFPFFPKHPRIARHRTEISDWRLDVSTNPFSGNVVCRLRERHGEAVYQQGAIGFRFRASWDVENAIYRVDGGAPRTWRNDLPELVHLGTPIDTGGIDNPTQGIVWIPLSRLEGANAIVIQPRPDRAQRTFHFAGFRGLYEDAVARGCTPDSRFVR
jgi:hypothetical protein